LQTPRLVRDDSSQPDTGRPRVANWRYMHSVDYPPASLGSVSPGYNKGIKSEYFISSQSGLLVEPSHSRRRYRRAKRRPGQSYSNRRHASPRSLCHTAAGRRVLSWACAVVRQLITGDGSCCSCVARLYSRRHSASWWSRLHWPATSLRHSAIFAIDCHELSTRLTLLFYRVRKFCPNTETFFNFEYISSEYKSNDFFHSGFRLDFRFFMSKYYFRVKKSNVSS